MPGEIIGEAAGELLKFVFRIIVEIVFEILIKGTGYAIVRIFKRRVNPDGPLVVFAGLLFWAGIIYLGCYIYEFMQVDSCLDSGGQYDYEVEECKVS